MGENVNESPMGDLYTRNRRRLTKMGGKVERWKAQSLILEVFLSEKVFFHSFIEGAA